MKKIILTLIAVLILTFTLVNAEEYDYSIEGESFVGTNFLNNGSNIASNAEASGGKFLSLYTTKAPAESYYAEYNVNVPKKGVYDLYVVASPVTSGDWSSKIYVSVNDGAKTLLSAEPISGTDIVNYRMKEYYLGALNLYAGDNSIEFIVDAPVSSGYYVAFIDVIGLKESSFRIHSISSEAPYNVFESNQSITLSVNSNAAATKASLFDWTLSDVYGNTIKTGSVTIAKNSSKADITFNGLDLGYYQLSVDGITSGFSIVKPLSERKKYDDTPFALDTSFSGQIMNFNRDTKGYARVLGLSGISWIRDRFWVSNNASYEDGEYTFTTERPSYIAALLELYGIKVSTAVDNMTANLNTGYGRYISDDLIAVYDCWKSLASYYNGTIDNWEIFNEVDNGGTVGSWDSPDLYAAFMKAAAVAVDDVSDAMISTQGSALMADDRSEYSKILMRNGVFDYSAFDNVHYHQGAAEPFADYHIFRGAGELTKQINAQKELDRRVPVWVTEAGISLKAPTGTDFTLEQQRVQAKYLVTSAVESIAEGTDKHFFFIGPNYHEGETQWGMMSESLYTPYMYAALPAQAAMTDMLGKGIYKGELKGLASGVKAYLFNNGDEDVMVLWSTAGDKAVTVNAEGAVYDMYGNEIASATGNISLTATAEPIYIKCTKVNESFINGRDAQQTAKKMELTDAKKVILLQKYSDLARGGSRRDGYMISDTDNKVTLEITNLSDKTMSGRIGYYTENGWKLDREYQDVTVEPMSVKSIEFTIIPANGATIDYLSFVGDFGGDKTSPSTAKLVKVNDGTITLEAETAAKAYSSGFAEYEKDGNKGFGVVTDNIQKYEIEFEVFSTNEGAYNLWALASVRDYIWSSNYNIEVNGELITPSSTNSKDVLYWASNHAVNWSLFNEIRLKKGLNTVKFSASTKRILGDKYLVSALDKLVLVPVKYTTWREAESYTTKTGMFYNNNAPDVSDSATMKLFTYGISNPTTENKLTYQMMVPKKGKYDVWVLSARANVPWLTKWKIGFDAQADYPEPVKEIYSYMKSDGQELYWYLIKDATTLSKGLHTLTIEGNEARTMDDGSYMFHIVDAVAIVPNDSWTPVWNIDEDKIDISSKYLLYGYNLNSVSKDMALPQELDGGIKVEWSCSNPERIKPDGTVIRPYYGDGNEKVTLTARLTSGEVSKEYSYDVTVLEAEKPQYQLKTTVADGNIKAVFENFTSTKATGKIYCAYYDKETEALADVKSETLDAAASGTDTAGFAFDSNYIMKLFVWNDELEAYISATGVEQ